MFGQKINEFDDSDGTINSFNETFPQTTLGRSCGNYVEIGNIVERQNMFLSSPFIRYLTCYDKDHQKTMRFEHDFGENNFMNNEDYDIDGSIRFKYIAKDLSGTVLAKAFNFEELAQKLNCSVNSVKRRIKSPIDENTNTELKFNITRIEL